MKLVKYDPALGKPIASDPVFTRLRRLARRLKQAGEIVGFGPDRSGIYLAFRPAGAAPDLEPLLYVAVRCSAVADLHEVDSEDEIELILDAPALAAIAARAELAAAGIVDLASRRSR